MTYRSCRVAPAILTFLALTSSPAVADESWTDSGSPTGGIGDQHIVYPDIPNRFGRPKRIHAVNAGDVNGDGLEDVAAAFDANGNSAYVTFSRAGGGVVDATGQGGFPIHVPGFSDGLAGVGDVNGDGLADIAVSNANATYVIFGKKDDAPVDVNNLGTSGFTITNNGFGNRAVAAGDVDGDGRADLLVSEVNGGAIVYTPANVAGTSIEASAAGPDVARLTTTAANQLGGRALVGGGLGDVDGDGHPEVLIGGNEPNEDFAAYGAVAPARGQTVDLTTAVGQGKAFALRATDHPFGGLDSVGTLGDENGDGRRDVVLETVGTRVVYTPALGTTVDISDLGAADGRGYRFASYSRPVDVGDQDSDGHGDIGTNGYVYFANPARETGNREAVYAGYWLTVADKDSFMAGAMGDMNGDGRRELLVAASKTSFGSNDSPGQYSVDIFDSAVTPTVGTPSEPVFGGDQRVTTSVDVNTGAGARGGGTMVMHPRIELATPTGPPVSITATPDDLPPSGPASVHLDLAGSLGYQSQLSLTRGQTYRIRVSFANGRGLRTDGPWRTFVYGQAPAPTTHSRPRSRPS